jgi:hypothetical protein
MSTERRTGVRTARAILVGLLLGALLLTGLPAPVWAGGTESGDPEARARHLKTVGLSLILPGLGHLADGQSRRAVPFLVAEAGFWAGFATYRVRGSLRRDSYQELAGIGAGIRSPKGRSDEYYRLIGVWPSSDSYNEIIRREARALYGDDLAGRASYFESHQVPADEAWSWESQAAWDRYRAKRRESQQAFRRARTAVALAAANRVAAILDFALFSHGREVAQGGLHLRCEPGPLPASARIGLSCELP